MCGETRIPRDMCAGKHATRGNTYHYDTGLKLNLVQLANRLGRLHAIVRLHRDLVYFSHTDYVMIAHAAIYMQLASC